MALRSVWGLSVGSIVVLIEIQFRYVILQKNSRYRVPITRGNYEKN
jgi:hypothetical protein